MPCTNTSARVMCLFVSSREYERYTSKVGCSSFKVIHSVHAGFGAVHGTAAANKAVNRSEYMGMNLHERRLSCAENSDHPGWLETYGQPRVRDRTPNLRSRSW